MDQKRRKEKSISGVSSLVICVALLLIGSVFFMAFLSFRSTLEQEKADDIRTRTKSIYNNLRSAVRMDRDGIRQKVLDLVPPTVWTQTNIPKPVANNEHLLPDWSQEHWTPISISLGRVTLCRLQFEDYYRSPHVYPMFKDLVAASHCNNGGNSKVDSMENLLGDIKAKAGQDEGRVVSPTGFIFHESRVGSTLVANLLASNPWSMVFSESAPGSEGLMGCVGCSRKKHVQYFRDIVTLMGRSPVHSLLFFKFQSITTTHMEIALEAFPDTPWIFLYRHPVQTVMSHLAHKGTTTGLSENAPCLRSKRQPPEKVRNAMKKFVPDGVSSHQLEAWCAAHLNMLCEHALEAHEQYGKYTGSDKQRGLIVNYDSLPGIVPKVVLPLFGADVDADWIGKMIEESGKYSKARSEKTFAGDSEEKDQRASEDFSGITKWANAILSPSYEKLEALSDKSISHANVPTVKDLPLLGSGHFDWAAVKEMPSVLPDVAGGNEALGELGGVSPPIERASVSLGGSQHRHFVETTSKGLGDPSNKLNPLTGRIEVGAFASDVNSSRYENIACPASPPKGYPATYPMKTVLDNWNTDDASVPPVHFDSLCHFDYQTQYDTALAYRNAEVPFVVFNIPDVAKVVERWRDMEYINQLVGPNTKYETETSEDNHFMYYNGRRGKGVMLQDWKPPTGKAKLTFSEWLLKAKLGHNVSLDKREHLYFRVSSGGKGNFLFDELPFYRPVPSLFIVEPEGQRGIHCRFGMKNVIAEAHYDGSRNMAASLGGLRRWILAHPNQCKSLYLLPQGHPSARHSMIDWSKPDYKKYSNFASAQVNEVIMKPGSVLYLPTDWFHYIVSLNINFQCNTRSGISHEYDRDISSCK